jgi:WD40 repeat protein
MERQRWEQIEDLLQHALDLEPSERSRFIERSCEQDEALRSELDALLSKEAKAHNFLESPAVFRVAEQTKATSPTVSSQVGHYHIEAHIGQGGMGEVFRARDETLRRVVALKTLAAEFTSDEERVQRFKQEAFAASRLNHPNIITIFEITDYHGTQFIVEEYVEGHTLRELLTDPETRKPRKLSVTKALEIAIQIAAALKAAHTAWIIHRDIKPENIMIREDGLVKVLDFGIAKLSEEVGVDFVEDHSLQPIRHGFDTASNQLTVPGAIMGTASYMSPEQARGEPLDGRTDLFSLGLLLFEMVIGERLLNETTYVKGAQVEEVLAANAWFGRIPNRLQRIIRKALRNNRDERYSSSGDMLDELKRLQRSFENRTARRIVGLSVLAVLGSLTIAALAAFFSVTEVWEEKILRDGHTAAVRRAVFSPDGRLLVSVGEDHQIIVWDFLRRERLKTLTDHTGVVNAVAFAPNGKWFVTGSEDYSIIVWDAISFEKVRVLTEHRAPVRGVTISPSGGLMVSFSSDSTDGKVKGRTFVWDTESWKTTHEFARGYPHGNHVFLENEHLLVDQDNGIRDLTTGRQIKGARYDWTLGWFTALDDRRGFAVGSDGVVTLFDFAEAKAVFKKHAHHDHGRSVAVSPDGKWLATAAERVVLWDAQKFEKIVPLEYESIVWSVAFSPDSRWLVSTHGDGAILVWDVAERELVANLREHSGGVRAVAFSPDGKRVATASADNSVIIWNTENSQKEAVLNGHQTRVTGVAFSSDGQWLASADQSGVVIRWDVVRRTPLITIKSPGEFRSSYFVAISPNGRFVATTFTIYDIETGQPLITPGVRWHQVYSGAFTRDGKRLVGVTDSGRLTLMDTQTWQVIEEQKWGGSPLVAFSLSPDERYFASGEDGKAVRLGSTATLRELAVIGYHQARIKSVSFSPDGKQVVSVGDDKKIALWDVNRRKLITTIGTHTSPIYAIAFSPDGQRLVSGEHDRSVRLYTRHRELWGFRLN